MESEKVKEIKELIDCDKKQNKLGGIIVVNSQFLIEVIALINELESENELLRNAKVVYENVDYCYEDLKKAEKRIDELKKENKYYYDRLNNLQTYIDNHEEIWKGNTNNALKQFAEMLKERYVDENLLIDGYFRVIDELLKEFEL